MTSRKNAIPLTLQILHLYDRIRKNLIDVCPRDHPYLTKRFFPPGIQLHNPPSFLVKQTRFARIYKVECGADYQIREIPIMGAGPLNFFWEDELIKMYFPVSGYF